MASTTFTDYYTPVVAAWLNDVNLSTYTTVPAVVASNALKAPIASPTFTGSVTIPGGTINSTSIGATTPAAGSFTTLSSQGGTTSTLQTTFPIPGAGTGGGQWASYYNAVKIGYLDFTLNNGTPGSEASTATIGVMEAGVLTQGWKLDNSGNITQQTSANTAVTNTVYNPNAGAGAYAQVSAQSNAGVVSIEVNSTVGGGISYLTSSATGGLVVGTSNSSNLYLYTNNVSKAFLDANGVFTIISATGGLGYGTGSGATIIQGSTSGKGTTVTVNKPTGKITLNNANLLANTVVSFQLTNSLIAAGDTVSVTTINGSYAAVGSYLVWAEGLFGGGCVISVWNRTGGALAEALGIQFNLIKGATS